MDKPNIKSFDTVCEILRGEDNPRNSEGDFAVLKNGDILFAYGRFRGTDREDDAPCDICGLISKDGGETFAALREPLVRAADHGVDNVMCPSFSRLPNGQLCLFYLCKFAPQSAFFLRRATTEEELFFGEPELVIPQKKGVYFVVNNSRVCTLSDGRFIVPAARHWVSKNAQGQSEAEYYANVVLFSSNDGKTWRQMPHVFSLPQRGYSETGLQEPGFVELPDGRLYVYFRTDRAFQFESISEDAGKSWSTPMQSPFTSPDSPMLIRRNPYTGLYYAFWNPIPNYNGRIAANAEWINAGRTPFVMAVSEDGVDFSDFTVLEDDPTRGYCYPAVCFLDARTFLLSYCCGGPEDGNCLTRTRIVRVHLS